MEMCGAAVGRDTSGRQTSGSEIDRIISRRAAHEVHAPVHLHETTDSYQASNLPPRQPARLQLLSCYEAQLGSSASGEAPFEYDVHAHYQTRAL
jgi:hypothetical protein